MASLTIILKANKANEKGEMPLYIRVIKGRKTKFISLGIKVHPNCWDEKKLQVKGKIPNSAKINHLISTRLSEMQGITLELETKEKYVSADKIKKTVTGKDTVSFIDFANSYISDLNANGKVGTYRRVKTVMKKFQAFHHQKDLFFNEFDLSLLKKYERYLRDDLKNCKNTVHANLKVFRKLFNDAVREDLIKPEQNPFTKFKMVTEKTTREFLSEGELKMLEELDLKEGTVMQHHLNMYIFSAYAAGLRISDLLQLRWKNYDGTSILITVQKTKQTLNVKLPSKAASILERYLMLKPERKEEDFIFPFLSNNIDYSNPAVLYSAISSNTAYANKNLKLIAKKANISKSISFHSSRHTWATRALNKGMRLELVSKLLAHSNIRTTSIYTHIVNEDLNKAMELFD
jgi:integrase/recombinase XerD